MTSGEKENLSVNKNKYFFLYFIIIFLNTKNGKHVYNIFLKSCIMCLLICKFCDTFRSTYELKRVPLN